MPLKKAVEMCLDGFITGSLSLIGLFKFARTYSFYVRVFWIVIRLKTSMTSSLNK